MKFLLIFSFIISLNFCFSQELEELFFYQNREQTLIQNLRFTRINDHEISFKLEIFKEECSNTISGTASSCIDCDVEIDEDEEGNAYPCIQYLYDDGNLQLQIRISLENDYAKIFYHSDVDLTCDFNTYQIMKAE